MKCLNTIMTRRKEYETTQGFIDQKKVGWYTQLHVDN